MDIIFLADALKIIDSHVPFDLTYTTADKKRRTGGKDVSLKNVVSTSRFYKHGIRTIKILSSGQTREFHIRLITKFNGKEIVW
ncbi:MAG TPA: hypothetical protein PLS10_07115 [Chitinophagales bacterium]|nr:hypothetical protein [Chitinophagales bacterium]